MFKVLKKKFSFEYCLQKYMYNQLVFLQRSTNTEFRTLDLAFMIQALYRLGCSV